MKRSKQFICLLLSLIIAVVFSNEAGETAIASTLTNASIQAKEAQIEAAKKEKTQIQNGLTNVKNLKKELEKSKNDLTAYVTELDANLSEIQAKINDLNEQITTKETEIETTEKELEEAIATQTAQYEAMKIRIKFMYEKGNDTYLSLMLSSNSLGDMMNRAEYIEKISAYDKRMLDQYVEYSEYVALCKEALEDEKAVLDETKKAQEDEEAALNDLIATKESEISKVSADITNKEAAIAEYEADLAAETETIRAL